MQHRLFPRVAVLYPIFCLLASLGFIPAASADDLSGSWSGYWASDSTGHRGPLRCTLTRIDSSTYRADFSGRFLKIVPFRYSVNLAVIQDGDTVILSGTHTLGRRLGDFTYQAEATSEDFVANYSSCKDQGRFVLTRCCSTH